MSLWKWEKVQKMLHEIDNHNMGGANVSGACSSNPTFVWADGQLMSRLTDRSVS